MPESVRYFQRVHDEASAVAKQDAYVRDLIARSFEILRMSLPDLFLGRKTQEPFPSEDHVEPAHRSLTPNEIETAGLRPD